jgi:hypothetical protein
MRRGAGNGMVGWDAGDRSSPLRGREGDCSPGRAFVGGAGKRKAVTASESPVRRREGDCWWIRVRCGLGSWRKGTRALPYDE